MGVILLKAWLRVSGLSDGVLKSVTLRHNSVTQYLFDPLVAHPLHLSGAERAVEGRATALADLQAEQARFAPFRRTISSS